MISYPMFPENFNPRNNGNGLWKRGANGEFDSYHRSAASSLSGYKRNFIFRIGWEWNNRGRPWPCLNASDSGAFKTYFQRIATILRARNSCWIDWSSDKEGKTDADVRQWYPGSSYVDFLGPNHYDFYPAIINQRAWDSAYNATRMGGPKGMGAWLNYARSQGKKLSFGEWALIPPNRQSGGDNPFFIEKMLDFFHDYSGSIAYESYFNKNAGSNRHRLADNPKAAAKYRAMM